MSAPRHSAAVPGVCAAGLAGAWRGPCRTRRVPEGGHRPRQRGAPDAERGQDALKHTPRPCSGLTQTGACSCPTPLGKFDSKREILCTRRIGAERRLE